MFEGCLYFNTTALARRLEKEWTAAFAPFGLTPPQGFMLRTILDRPGLAPNELAEALVIARPTATRLLDGLEAKGLVLRRSSAEDGRGQAIEPTAEAVAIRTALNQASQAVTRRLKRALGESGFAGAVDAVRDARLRLD
ncbi:MarR family winged helix-turn-helix transcriptional regulator [Lysobacter silvisoli]|uniref:MarR family transcriptional regulator n=1 Tax=Lysobacter silvisoli TaxID=2293254 RepID=A0A371K603_9GAMM|nr:MarR family transcriptional regulator [Lysobacter silvisoli]RDZ29369.1 MarR family transcriptional regulator [Lysobacter silvisoli]